jgi:hypothetical protein
MCVINIHLMYLDCSQELYSVLIRNQAQSILLIFFLFFLPLQDEELEKMKAQLADMEKEAAKLQEVQVSH